MEIKPTQPPTQVVLGLGAEHGKIFPPFTQITQYKYFDFDWLSEKLSREKLLLSFSDFKWENNFDGED